MICTRCKIDKPESEFHRRSTFYGKYVSIQSKCKQCSKEIYQEWHKVQTKEFMDYKQTCKCEFCGENHISTLDFHHVDPSIKDAEISKLVLKAKFPKVMEEIKKCICLCSNCHRKLHWDLKHKTRRSEHV